MKKRILAIALALLMCLSLLPVAASADAEVIVEEEPVEDAFFEDGVFIEDAPVEAFIEATPRRKGKRITIAGAVRPPRASRRIPAGGTAAAWSCRTARPFPDPFDHKISFCELRACGADFENWSRRSPARLRHSFTPQWMSVFRFRRFGE